MQVVVVVVVLLLSIQKVSSFKLASYNTFQFPSNIYASELLIPQFSQIAASNIDTFCFQELYLLNTTVGYINQLKQLGYPYSFGTIDIFRDFDPQSLELPRIACNSTQYAAITSNCSIELCADFYNEGNALEYHVCMATIEQQGLCSGFTEIMYSECVGCLALATGILAPSLQRHPTIQESAGWCFYHSDSVNFYFNITDGAYIVSKLPIVNTWSFILPSGLFISKRVNIAQINICDDCTDSRSIIVGCTHLEPTDYINDQNVVLNIDGISSHVGLNRAQTKYILENIFNDNLLNNLGISDEADNIYGAFLLGDMNSGKFFDRCSYQLPADDCVDVNGEPMENVFNLFERGGLIDAPDIRYKPGPLGGSYNPDPVCTQCINPDRDDYNPLIQTSSDVFIYDPDTQMDLDHILIQDGYCHNFKAKSFGQIFTDKIVNLDSFGFDGLTPASDHYGVVIELDFKRRARGGDVGNGLCQKRNNINWWKAKTNPRISRMPITESYNHIRIDNKFNLTATDIILVVGAILLILMNNICILYLCLCGGDKQKSV